MKTISLSVFVSILTIFLGAFIQMTNPLLIMSDTDYRVRILIWLSAMVMALGITMIIYYIEVITIGLRKIEFKRWLWILGLSSVFNIPILFLITGSYDSEYGTTVFSINTIIVIIHKLIKSRANSTI